LIVIYNNTGGTTKRMVNLISAVGKADNQYEQIFKCRLESWQKTPTPSGEKGIKIFHHEDNIV
jgi:hypothetical protein